MDPLQHPHLKEWLAKANFEASQLQEAQDSPLWKKLCSLLTEFYDDAAGRLVAANGVEEMRSAQVDARAAAMLVNLFQVPLMQVREQIRVAEETAEQRAGRLGADFGPETYK